MIQIALYNLLLFYIVTCSWVKVQNCHDKLWAVLVANNLYKDVRNGSDEVGPVGCQIFGGHEKCRRSTVKDSPQRPRNKKYHDDR